MSRRSFVNSCKAHKKETSREQLQNLQNKTCKFPALHLHQTQKQEQEITQGYSQIIVIYKV